MITFSNDYQAVWPHMAMLGALHLIDTAGIRDVRGGHDEHLHPGLDVDPTTLAELLHTQAVSIAAAHSPWRRLVPGTKRPILAADWGSPDPAVTVDAMNTREALTADLPETQQQLVRGLGRPTHPEAQKPRWACNPWDMTTLQTGGQIVTRRILPAAEHTATRTIDDIAAALNGTTTATWKGPDLIAGWRNTAVDLDPAIGLLSIFGLAMLPVTALDTITLGGVRTPSPDAAREGTEWQEKAIPGWLPKNGGRVRWNRYLLGWGHNAVEEGLLALPLSVRPMSPAWWRSTLHRAQWMPLLQAVDRRQHHPDALHGLEDMEATVLGQQLSTTIGGLAVWRREVRSAGPLLERRAAWLGISDPKTHTLR